MAERKIDSSKSWTKTNPHILIRGVDGRLFVIRNTELEQYAMDDDGQKYMEDNHPVHVFHTALFMTADGDDVLDNPQAYAVQDNFPENAQIGPGENLAYLNLDFRPAWSSDDEDD